MGDLGLGLLVFVNNLSGFDCFCWILCSDGATDSMGRFLFVVPSFPFIFVHAWGAGHMTSLLHIIVFFFSFTVASFSSGVYLSASEMEFAVV